MVPADFLKSPGTNLENNTSVMKVDNFYNVCMEAYGYAMPLDCDPRSLDIIHNLLHGNLQNCVFHFLKIPSSVSMIVPR